MRLSLFYLSCKYYYSKNKAALFSSTNENNCIKKPASLIAVVVRTELLSSSVLYFLSELQGGGKTKPSTNTRNPLRQAATLCLLIRRVQIQCSFFQSMEIAYLGKL